MTHVRLVPVFYGSYDEENAEQWCLVKETLCEVFEYRQADTGTARHGILASCFKGEAKKHWEIAKKQVEGEENSLEDFKARLQILKANYFESDNPRDEQVKWLCTLKNPDYLSWQKCIAFVDHVRSMMECFPKDLDRDRNDLSVQQEFTDGEMANLILKNIPTKWYTSLLGDGKKAAEYTLPELKKRLLTVSKRFPEDVCKKASKA